MLHTLLIIIHVLVALVLSTVVLLQSSKGGGLAGAFGGAGGAPQQLLGSRGMTSLLHKATVWLATAFFVTSFLLFVTDRPGTGGAGKSVIDEAARKGQLDLPTQEAPAQLPSDVPAPAQTPTPTDQPAGGSGGGGGGQ